MLLVANSPCVYILLSQSPQNQMYGAFLSHHKLRINQAIRALKHTKTSKELIDNIVESFYSKNSFLIFNVQCFN